MESTDAPCFRPGVDAVAEEQDFKIGRLTVTINSGLLERDVAVGLNIDTECFHIYCRDIVDYSGDKITAFTAFSKNIGE